MWWSHERLHYRSSKYQWQPSQMIKTFTKITTPVQTSMVEFWLSDADADDAKNVEIGNWNDETRKRETENSNNWKREIETMTMITMMMLLAAVSKVKTVCRVKITSSSRLIFRSLCMCMWLRWWLFFNDSLIYAILNRILPHTQMYSYLLIVISHNLE